PRAKSTSNAAARRRPAQRGEPAVVTLCGTQDQIDLAKSLIDQLLSRQLSSPSRRQQPQPPAQQPSASQLSSLSRQLSSLSRQLSSLSRQLSSLSRQPQQAPPASIPSTNEPISVCVSAVGDDPLVFYLLCDNEQSRSLSNLVCSMVEYYNDQTWQRARVVSVDLTQQQQAMLDVDCLDYGDSLMVQLAGAFRLQPQFLRAALPGHLPLHLEPGSSVPYGRVLATRCIAEISTADKVTPPMNGIQGAG
uniref:Tudor domain-containing protein n=1 Tax=Macrostomum lignano TaxID=282301 RepID=A0A1I8FRA4_9PLAT